MAGKLKPEFIIDEILRKSKNGTKQERNNEKTMEDVDDNIDVPSHFIEINKMIMEDSTSKSSTHHLGKEDASKPNHGTINSHNALLAQVIMLEMKLKHFTYFTIKVIQHSIITLAFVL